MTSTSTPQDWAGTSVLVTGAGRGIGRAIASTFAARGARVALAGRTESDLERVRDVVIRQGGSALVVPTDVSDASSAEAMARVVEQEFGRIDVLVANSGIAGPTKALWDITPEEWDATQAVNVRGVFLSCRAVLPGMISAGSGSVVLIGSITGKRPMSHRTPYAASKMALIGLLRSLALEVGPHGIRVNLVSPGPVTGPRLEAALEGQSQLTGRSTDELRADFAAHAPLRRLVEPEDVASAVRYLAGDQAAGITGQDLNVSAGTTMY